MSEFQLGMGDVARCDVCLQKYPEYTHFTKAFHIPAQGAYPEYVDDGAWGACPTCHQLILDGDSDALCFRGVLGSMKELGQANLGWITIVTTAMMENLTGEWIEDTSTTIGEWPEKHERDNKGL